MAYGIHRPKQTVMAMAASLTTRKRALRSSLTSTLRALPQDDVSTQCEYMHHLMGKGLPLIFLYLFSANAVLGRVLSAPWFSNATTISCYLSMPVGEVDTSAIVAAILNSGAGVPILPLSGAAFFMIRDSPEDPQERTCLCPRWILHFREGWTCSEFKTRRIYVRSPVASGESKNRRFSTGRHPG